MADVAMPNIKVEVATAAENRIAKMDDEEEKSESSTFDSESETAGSNDSGAPDSSDAAAAAGSSDSQVSPRRINRSRHTPKHHRRRILDSPSSMDWKSTTHQRISSETGLDGAVERLWGITDSGTSKWFPVMYEIPMSATTVTSRLRVAALIARDWHIDSPTDVILVLPDGVREESRIYLETDKRTGRISRRWTAIVRHLDIRAGDLLLVKASEPLRPLVVSLGLTRCLKSESLGLSDMEIYEQQPTAIPDMVAT